MTTPASQRHLIIVHTRQVTTHRRPYALTSKFMFIVHALPSQSTRFLSLNIVTVINLRIAVVSLIRLLLDRQARKQVVDIPVEAVQAGLQAANDGPKVGVHIGHVQPLAVQRTLYLVHLITIVRRLMLFTFDRKEIT